MAIVVHVPIMITIGTKYIIKNRIMK